MVRLLMAFAWVGLAIGVIAGSLMLAGAFIAVEDGVDSILVWIPPIAHLVGSTFWFALCSVLAETLTTVRRLEERLD